MILNDYRCKSGHRFEAVIPTVTAPAPDCPECGEYSQKIITGVRIGAHASAGASREEMPKSWKGMGNGDPEAVKHWRGKMLKREKLEEKHPELGGDRRPILAHEGIFDGRPLRAGDDIASSVQKAAKASTPTSAKESKSE